MNSRRKFLNKSLLGIGSLPVLSALSGLPASFLISGQAQAATGEAKFCILSTSSGGQPLNIYAPGAFPKNGNDPANRIGHPVAGQNGINYTVGNTTLDVSHLANPGMRRFGADNMIAAQMFDFLPDNFANHLCHGWYVSGTNAHPELNKVLTAHGALKSQYGATENLAAVIAQENAGALGTLYAYPVGLGREFTPSSQGKTAPRLSPESLSELFGGADGSLPVDGEDFLAIYQSFVDSYYRNVYRTELSPSQRVFVDNHLLSVTEAEETGGELDLLLNCPNQYTPDLECTSSTDGLPTLQQDGFAVEEEDYWHQFNQLRTALALLYLRITPVVTVDHRYGGDNHGDANLERETLESLSTMAVLSDFHRLLTQHSRFQTIADKLVFAGVDVFGRTVELRDGRDHYGDSTAGFIWGQHLSNTVLGGPGNGKVSAYDAATGVVSANGNVGPDESLPSFLKTVMCASGMSLETVNQRLQQGIASSAIFA